MRTNGNGLHGVRFQVQLWSGKRRWSVGSYMESGGVCISLPICRCGGGSWSCNKEPNLTLSVLGWSGAHVSESFARLNISHLRRLHCTVMSTIGRVLRLIGAR